MNGCRKEEKYKNLNSDVTEAARGEGEGRERKLKSDKRKWGSGSLAWRDAEKVVWGWIGKMILSSYKSNANRIGVLCCVCFGT